MKRDFRYVLRILSRWAVLSVALFALLFTAAGTTKIASLRAYLAVFSTMLLTTMLTVDPALAQERAHPGPEAGPTYLRFATGLLFLLTVTTAAFARGHLHKTHALPNWLSTGALAVFAISSSFQTWAMIVNPFFSPAIRLQDERGHRVISSGPYRFIRHPGYLAMSISVPASGLAIGSWLALVPATVFVWKIHQRAKNEDQFLKDKLTGYAAYAQRVSAGLPFVGSL